MGTDVLGVPAVGGVLDLPFTAIIAFRDGLMAGEHVWFDLAEFCAQVGADVVAVRAAAAELGAALGAGVASPTA